ncbi:zinc finger SWIM domain-containing protein 7 isoform X1 [Delphinapterus leucas]|uniref:Zinc finger SWIM domain-containing protein 7 isoform X1 n=1 Tax=Delphinapterus leucas TaxID=9749 RepID=A0A2Y9MC17_DELLE|nr:zinc finger SWIM domain-containing protein 7 isoform X1 [Delphinapterus leucas]XP_030619218.1 zinc finger SWIM domain-containing protein 7 isoform X1 [Delphinapterus leucas]
MRCFINFMFLQESLLEPSVPDEHLLSLKFVFGSSAVQALDLVDRHSVTLISSPSGRRVYQSQLQLCSKTSSLRVPVDGAAPVWNIADLTAEREEDIVLGSSGRTYVCLASCHYCSCPAFAFSVLRKGDSLLVRMGRAPPTAAELGERLRALAASFKSCTKWGFDYMWKQLFLLFDFS